MRNMRSNCKTLAINFIAAVIGILSCAATEALSAPPVATDPDRIVVMISVDGLANFYMNDPAAPMPTIRRLAQEGAVADGMKAVNPTVTWPNHTSLVTGVSPAVHGVVGNNFYDRVKGENVTLIWDPVLDKDQIVRVPTIYDVANAAGLKTASIRWPASRNAKSLDWTSPDVVVDSLVRQYTTPELLRECKEAGLDIDQAYSEDKGDRKKTRAKMPTDELWTRAFMLLLEKHRPNLALLHLLNVDHVEHGDGPRSKEAYAAIAVADDQVRRIWELLQKEYPGKATIVIVSDHGFSANEKAVFPNVALRDAGLIETTGDRITAGSVRVVPQGGAALIYVLDEANRDAVISRTKKTLGELEGVAKVIGVDEFSEYGIGDPRRDPRAPDMVIFAEMGHYFGDTAAGALPVKFKPELKGSHGHDSSYPDLRAVFIACGAGIKPGTKLGEVDNRSVAPTLAQLLGVELPTAEGKPLTKALAE